MYTGIIKHIGTVNKIERKTGLATFSFSCPDGFLQDIELGASISINGVCLTVTNFTKNSFTADAMQETLRCTTLDSLVEGQKIHLERSAFAGAEVGGHILSGHVDGTAEVVSIYKPENNYSITFKVNEKLNKYIFEKGYIAIDGASLTVSNRDLEKRLFSVWLIPETLRQTTFSKLKEGSFVNIEIDRNTQVIVDTIHQAVSQALLGSGSANI